MPVYLKRLQFLEDSIRGRKWFEMTKDSVYIKRFITTNEPAEKKLPLKENPVASTWLAVLPDEKQFRQTRNQTSIL
jgi:penicillin-binding protein 2